MNLDMDKYNTTTLTKFVRRSPFPATDTVGLGGTGGVWAAARRGTRVALRSRRGRPRCPSPFNANSHDIRSDPSQNYQRLVASGT